MLVIYYSIIYVGHVLQYHICWSCITVSYMLVMYYSIIYVGHVLQYHICWSCITVSYMAVMYYSIISVSYMVVIYYRSYMVVMYYSIIYGGQYTTTPPLSTNCTSHLHPQTPNVSLHPSCVTIRSPRRPYLIQP